MVWESCWQVQSFSCYLRILAVVGDVIYTTYLVERTDSCSLYRSKNTRKAAETFSSSLSVWSMRRFGISLSFGKVY